MRPIIPDHAPYHQRNLVVPDALLSGPGSPRDPPIRRTASSRRERTPHALRDKLALLAMVLCLAGGIGAATALAGKSSGSPQQTTTTTCSNEDESEQGVANDMRAAANDVEQEAQRQQADDEQGAAQGQDDNSDEQGEDCNDDGGN